MSDPRFDLTELKTRLDEFGFVVIPNLIASDLADRMADRLLSIMRGQPSDRPNQGLGGIFNYTDPADDELFLHLITNPTYLALVEHLLGPEFQLCEVGAVWVKPGAPQSALHADVPVPWFHRLGRPVPPVCFMVNCIWMLTEFTRENGGTVLMPFSHRSGKHPREGIAYEHLVSAEGPPGSIVIFNGSIWHTSGGNQTTDKQRLGLSSGYHAAWLDPTFIGWRLMTREVRDRMPPLVQQMQRHVVDKPGQRAGNH